MKVLDVQKAAAQYKTVHRAAVEALNTALALAELDKVSKHSAEVAEIYDAASNCRTRLIEALYWYQGLHQMLMVRTDEGREALKKYDEELKKQAAKGEAQGGGSVCPSIL